MKLSIEIGEHELGLLQDAASRAFESLDDFLTAKINYMASLEYQRQQNETEATKDV